MTDHGTLSPLDRQRLDAMYARASDHHTARSVAEIEATPIAPWDCATGHDYCDRGTVTMGGRSWPCACGGRRRTPINHRDGKPDNVTAAHTTPEQAIPGSAVETPGSADDVRAVRIAPGASQRVCGDPTAGGGQVSARGALIAAGVGRARAYLGGGDSPPFHSDTTTIIARALVACVDGEGG